MVVCTYNGARTLHDCLSGLTAMSYPNFEVLLVDDGSTDTTVALASEYDVTVISTPNRGLSAARTLGAERASGEIVAYIDDDARPDPDWLFYVAWSFLTTEHAVIGGPNIAPEGDGPIAFCVANAPGGPVHVLLSDELAEHVPGCNLAVRRDRCSKSADSIRGFGLPATMSTSAGAFRIGVGRLASTLAPWSGTTAATP